MTTIQFSNRGKIARFFFGLNLGTGGALEPSRALFFQHKEPLWYSGVVARHADGLAAQYPRQHAPVL